MVEALDVEEVWYSARVLKIKGSKVLVSFDGWSSDWDEWLAKDSRRLRPHRGWGTAAKPNDWQIDATVEALDLEGKWCKSKVLHVSELKVMVHYGG